MVITMKTKALIAILAFALLIMGGCAKSEENITFTAAVESVSEASIIVTTTDDVGFDRASVGFPDDFTLAAGITAGSRVQITILPEIRESYPVQVTAVSITQINTGTYETISAQEAKAMMENQDVIILDVRSQEEYDTGFIPGAVLLPVDEIAQKVQEVLPDKRAVILVYCRSGNRSARASQTLANLGYAHVYDFGGIMSWPYETAMP